MRAYGNSDPQEAIQCNINSKHVDRYKNQQGYRRHEKHYQPMWIY